MKESFNAQGAFCDTLQSAFEIEIHPDGEFARVRYSYLRSNGRYKYSRARWQRVKFAASGAPFVTFNGRPLPLDNFCRLY